MYRLLPDWLDSDILSLMKQSTSVIDMLVNGMMLLMRDNDLRKYHESNNYAKHILTRKEMTIKLHQIIGGNLFITQE